MLLEFFLGGGGVRLHALHGGVDFSLTPDSELLGIAAKLISSFSPRLQLGRRLKLECRRLLLDVFAEAFDVFLDLGLERIPLWLQSCFCGGPCGLVGFGLLLDGVPEDITALAQVSECLLALSRASAFTSPALLSSDVSTASISSSRSLAQFT
jgi:hypothetical protein